MPMKKHAPYVITFELPDGKHLAYMNSIANDNDSDARFIMMAATRAIGTNPDAKVLDIEPLDPDDSFGDMQRRVEALKAEDPDRPLAHELGLDTPNRILTDVEIPRGLAARKTPG